MAAELPTRLLGWHGASAINCNVQRSTMSAFPPRCSCSPNFDTTHRASTGGAWKCNREGYRLSRACLVLSTDRLCERHSWQNFLFRSRILCLSRHTPQLYGRTFWESSLLTAPAKAGDGTQEPCPMKWQGPAIRQIRPVRRFVHASLSNTHTGLRPKRWASASPNPHRRAAWRFLAGGQGPVAGPVGPFSP